MTPLQLTWPEVQIRTKAEVFNEVLLSVLSGTNVSLARTTSVPRVLNS
jgi:hypothetical protein